MDFPSHGKGGFLPEMAEVTQMDIFSPLNLLSNRCKLCLEEWDSAVDLAEHEMAKNIIYLKEAIKSCYVIKDLEMFPSIVCMDCIEATRVFYSMLKTVHFSMSILEDFNRDFSLFFASSTKKEITLGSPTTIGEDPFPWDFEDVEPDTEMLLSPESTSVEDDFKYSMISFDDSKAHLSSKPTSSVAKPEAPPSRLPLLQQTIKIEPPSSFPDVAPATLQSPGYCANRSKIYTTTTPFPIKSEFKIETNSSPALVSRINRSLRSPRRRVNLSKISIIKTLSPIKSDVEIEPNSSSPLFTRSRRVVSKPRRYSDFILSTSFEAGGRKERRMSGE